MTPGATFTITHSVRFAAPLPRDRSLYPDPWTDLRDALASEPPASTTTAGPPRRTMAGDAS